LNVQPTATIDLDLGGSTSGNYDRLQVGTSVSVGSAATVAGYGRLVLRLAPGYTPALGEALPVMTYASVAVGSAFHRIDANYALDYAARFDPTALQVFPAPRITIDNPSVLEGDSGTTPMTFNLRLSQAFSQTVSVQIYLREGTASDGLLPVGDYLYPGSASFTFVPGQTLQTMVFQINGDTLVEADESFAVEIARNKLQNAAIGNGIPGDPFGIGTILTDDLPANTRYVLVGKDNGTTDKKIRRYTTAGTFIDTWDDRMPPTVLNDIVTGMCFSPTGDVLATRFGYSGPILYGRFGVFVNEDFAAPNVLQNHESCVYDRAGNVYIGIAGISGSPDASVAVRKYNRYGDLLDTFVMPTGVRGTDWIDLAGDQCTIYYTSEDTSVRRYNICTHTALPVFATGLTGPYCYALRLRPNREVMVACQDAVHRISPLGINLQTYPRASIGETQPNGLFAMNLDPDGTSFWTAGILSGNVFHVDIASGAVLGSFNSGAGGVSGLAIYDELHDDVIFADEFESAPIALPIVAQLQPQPECEHEFWPEVRDMPPFIPTWMSIVLRGDGACEE
jgi:Calx-beta domain